MTTIRFRCRPNLLSLSHSFPLFPRIKNLEQNPSLQLAIYGSFSAPKQHEIVVVRASTSLEILRPDPTTGRLRTLASADAFGNIRSIAPFRLPGSGRDVVLVGADSGRLVILEFDPRRRAFVKVHQETFGKSGVRRVVPGQFVAADPRGRAAVVAAVEKAKLIYVLNRETTTTATGADGNAAPGAGTSSSSSSSHLTISSPLEANKSRAITFAVAGLDVGFDNPVFAAIELDYTGADEDPTGRAAAEATKTLSLYRLDLGLNHVSRISSLPVDNGASSLLAVPGGGDGPGGVLVCCENFLVYRSCAAALEAGSTDAAVSAASAAEELRVPLPRRSGLPSHRGTLVVAAAAHKQKSMFFFLLQSEYGDLYKVTLETGGGGGKGGSAAGDKVTDVVVRYFDTIPPSNSLCVLRTGFLFSAAEAGDHALYQFSGLGDDADAAEARASENSAKDGGAAPMVPPLFEPRREPRNLVLVDELDSVAPLLDLRLAAPVLLRSIKGGGGASSSSSQQHVITPAAAAAAFYAACGRGPRSTLRLLRPGAALAEVAASPLPGAPTGVWTVRRSPADAADAYIVVSFTNATLVLAVGDAVEEVSDSGFSGATRTLFAGALADGSLVQAHPGGLRHCARAGGRGAVEWRAPGRRAVVAAASNGRQVALALAGGEVVAFELDSAGGGGEGGGGGGGGSLLEVDRKEIGADVGAVDIPPVPEGRLRSRFLAVGAYDGTVRVLSLDPGDGLKALAVQATGSPPESLLLLDAAAGDGDGGDAAASSSAATADATDDSGLYLHAGLANGILLRVAVDRVTGQLSDARSRLLGTRAPKLVPLPLGGGGGGSSSSPSAAPSTRAMLALSSRAWLAHASGGRYSLVPLSAPGDAPVDHAAPFASDACPDGSGGVCAVGGGDLRVLQLERASLEAGAGGTGGFTATSARLRYTPRRLALLPEIGAVAVAESDHDVVSAVAAADGNEDDGGGVEFDEEAAAARERVGATRAPREEEQGEPSSSSAAWASALRVVDGRTLATRAVLELPAGEAVTALCSVRFSGAPEHGSSGKGSPPVLAVGTARRLRLSPEVSAEEGFIRLYRIVSRSGGGGGDGGDGAAADAGSKAAAASAPTTTTTALELIHSTPVGGIPGALCAFRGKLLAGVGRTVRLYDAGRKKLLRKCEASGAHQLPSRVVALAAVGGRVFAGDAQESVHLFRYRASDNALYPFADEALPRHVTCSAAMLPLDYDTAAVGDKFGTVAALRLPAAASAAAEADPTGGKFAFGGGGGGDASSAAAAAAAMGAAGAPPVVGAPHKLATEASFYVGDAVTSLSRGTLQAGVGGNVGGGDDPSAAAPASSRETLVYSTLSGSIGALLPLSSRDDVEFFSSLEARLRSDAPGATQLAGRDHASWRSSFYPARHVVDGDLCERFSSLPAAARAAIAKALDRTPLEVVRKLEDARNSVL